MTLAQLISFCEETRPSQYDKDILTGWVNEIEHRVYDEVLNMASHHEKRFEPYKYDKDSEVVLQVPDAYSDVYTTYLYAKIDFTNSEIERYNNDMTMHNAAWGAYAGWYRRHHIPKHSHHHHFYKEHEDPLDIHVIR